MTQENKKRIRKANAMTERNSSSSSNISSSQCADVPLQAEDDRRKTLKEATSKESTDVSTAWQVRGHSLTGPPSISVSCLSSAFPRILFFFLSSSFPRSACRHASSIYSCCIRYFRAISLCHCLHPPRSSDHPCCAAFIPSPLPFSLLPSAAFIPSPLPFSLLPSFTLLPFSRSPLRTRIYSTLFPLHTSPLHTHILSPLHTHTHTHILLLIFSLFDSTFRFHPIRRSIFHPPEPSPPSRIVYLAFSLLVLSCPPLLRSTDIPS